MIERRMNDAIRKLHAAAQSVWAIKGALLRHCARVTKGGDCRVSSGGSNDVMPGAEQLKQ
ncbi:hypothetical protein E4L95_15075 [Paracoccus liaowanqingii]|uniref:Uncharacterized protein n=2 Tax=Paracoccus liaowanqingii TaxID=2560053 RepID=A0A4Z1BTD5_9RHOB|nr:hypothetical protein E4L95_15075 [Paracoccus liaowanqingii]